MHEFGQSIVRMASFTGKELREVVRRPGVLASLILGPFVIMFIFGLGYSGYREPFVTEIVIPQGNDFPRDPAYYADLAPGRLDVVNVGDDPAPAEQRLRDGEIDLLITPVEFLKDSHPLELLLEERHVVVGWKDNPLFAGPLSKEAYLQSGHVAVRIFDRDTFVENILYKLVPERRIEVIAQSFIQVPWLLRGSMRISVMHERLARVSAPVFDLVTADTPFELPIMHEMMQYHSTRSNDVGLAWLRNRLKRFAQAE